MSRIWCSILLVLFLVIGLSVGMPDRREVQASEVEAKIRAGEPAEFDNCVIVGDLNLSGLVIEEPVHFDHTIFRNSVNLKSTIFNGIANFKGSIFNGVNVTGEVTVSRLR